MNEHYPFTNPPLPYEYSALEPFIDEKTMHFHHDKHLETYVTNLNNTLSSYPQFHTWTLPQLLANIPSLPETIQTAVTNNGGGVFNHIFYFSNLANPAAQMPSGKLKEAITNQYGDFDALKNELKAAALSVFGSGYAWLVVDAAGNLKIITTKNQDNPFALGMCPILNIDVWEHAYYLKHQNLRASYIDDLLHVINWDKANTNYENCFASAIGATN